MKVIKIKGGLGNQMFQYAFYKSFENRSETYVNFDFFKKNKAHNGLELEKLFEIELENNELIDFLLRKNFITNFIRSISKKLGLLKIYKFEDTCYEEKIIKDKTNLIIYDGYWQSEKYFKNIEVEIKKEFTFPKLDIKNQDIAIQIKNEESVSVHVRRGDYIGNKVLGGLITKEYYEKAMEYIERYIQKPKYYIFSDDIEWCKKELDLDGREVIFITHNKGEESYKDMQLMSLCKHNIIPNSSFSWWGAWLNENPNKIVIAPKRWFTKESRYKYEDIVPESWIKIDNEK